MASARKPFEWVDQVTDGIKTVRAIDAFIRRWGSHWFAGLRDGKDPTQEFYVQRVDSPETAKIYLMALGLLGSGERLIAQVNNGGL